MLIVLNNTDFDFDMENHKPAAKKFICPHCRRELKKDDILYRETLFVAYPATIVKGIDGVVGFIVDWDDRDIMDEERDGYYCVHCERDIYPEDFE